MSENLEPCLLQDATHVEVGGKVYKIETDGIAQIVLGSKDKTSFPTRKIGIVLRIRDGHWHTIFMDCFPILGIQPLKEKKREPIEFVGFTKYVSRTLSHIINVPLGTPPQTRFKCVEILENEE